MRNAAVCLCLCDAFMCALLSHYLAEFVFVINGVTSSFIPKKNKIDYVVRQYNTIQ